MSTAPSLPAHSIYKYKEIKTLTTWKPPTVSVSVPGCLAHIHTTPPSPTVTLLKKKKKKSLQDLKMRRVTQISHTFSDQESEGSLRGWEVGSVGGSISTLMIKRKSEGLQNDEESTGRYISIPFSWAKSKSCGKR